MFEVVNTWVAMGLFRPNHPDSQTARSFAFRHIRPTQDIAYMTQSGDTLKLRTGEVSLIGGGSGDAFNCYKRVGGDPTKMYDVNDVMAAAKGTFILWRLPYNNLYGGPWEVFNGPKRIVIRQTRT